MPTQNQLMLPLLAAIDEAGGSARPGALYDKLAQTLGVADVDRSQTATLNGREVNLWERRVRWARQTAVVKGLVSRETRGLWQLTDHANVALRNARRGTILTVFETSRGVMLWASAEDAIGVVERGSVDLLFTSPPYPLNRPRPYDNLAARPWLDWMLRLCEGWREVLSPTGSLMLNLGTVWNPNEPTTNDYIERLTIALQDQLGLHYCQRLEWWNPSKLPQPLAWVGLNRVRVTPATEAILWMATSPNPKANNRNVLWPYGASMQRVLAKGQPTGRRPSGHTMRDTSFAIDNGGSIPHNVIALPNAASNDVYHRRCRESGEVAHPATFPQALAEFCINLTTEKGDLVADFLAGSGTTARAAESLDRYWICSERSLTYAKSARFRFDNPTLAIA